MTIAELLALAKLGADLFVAIGKACSSIGQGRDIELDVIAEIRRCAAAISALPGIHAAQQDELRRAVDG